MDPVLSSTLFERPYSLPPLPPDQFYVDYDSPDSLGNGALVFVDDSDPFLTAAYRLETVLYRGRTALQEVLIAESYNFGLMLVLDGAIQGAEDDEALYHELLVQPAMLCHPQPRDVLIIGGCDGGALCEALVHRSVSSATLVDLDRELVELSRQYLIDWHRGAFGDPRLRLVIDDGRRFVTEDDGRYDVVIIDPVDWRPDGVPHALYTREFYELIRRRLRPGGVVAVQSQQFSFLRHQPHAAIRRTLRAVFPEVHSYHVYIPSFLGAWGFLIASDWFTPRSWSGEVIDRAIGGKLGTQWLDHVTGDLLKSCFAFSKEGQFLLDQEGPILEDGVRFVPPPNIGHIKLRVRQVECPSE